MEKIFIVREVRAVSEQAQIWSKFVVCELIRKERKRVLVGKSVFGMYFSGAASSCAVHRF